MAIDVSSIQTFTDSELLTLYRNAMAQLAINKSATINGRTVTREDLPAIRETVQWLEQRINDANLSGDGSGGNVAYVRFDDPI